MLPDASLTTLVAIYAAVVSTLVFIWNLQKDFRDRSKLAITVACGFPLEISDGKATKLPKQTTVRVVNRGRRACTLVAVGLVRRPTCIDWLLRRLFLQRQILAEVKIQGLPKRIEYEELWEGQLDWKNFFLTAYGEQIGFYAEDSLGRRAYSRRFKVDHFKDPDFENEDELPYSIDDALRQKLNQYRPARSRPQ